MFIFEIDNENDGSYCYLGLYYCCFIVWTISKKISNIHPLTVTNLNRKVILLSLMTEMRDGRHWHVISLQSYYTIESAVTKH
jgi:hypothetical protein